MDCYSDIRVTAFISSPALSFTNVARIGMWAWQVGGTNLGVKGFGQPTINSEGKTSTVSFVPGADGSTGSGGSTTFVIDGGTVGGGGSATSGVSTGIV